MRRSDRRGQGWQVRFQVLGESHGRYFADRQFGSAEAALAAAAAFAAHDLALHRELLALHRRLAPRATCRSGTPGVSRYAARPGRGAHWMAYFTDPATGRRQSVRFAISVYGEPIAQLLAHSWRARAIAPCLERYIGLLQQVGTCPTAPPLGKAGSKAPPRQITSL